MYAARFTFPGSPRAMVIEAQLDALCLANAVWYLEEWAAGRKPHCCCKCGNVMWAEPPLSREPLYQGAPSVFARTNGKGGRPTASCAEIVCVDAGAKIAKLYKEHSVQLRDGLDWFCSHVEKTGAGTYHAYLKTPDGIKDPSIELEPYKVGWIFSPRYH